MLGKAHSHYPAFQGVLVALIAIAAVGPTQAAMEASAVAPRLGLLALVVCAGLGLRQVGLVRRDNSLLADFQGLAVFLAASIAFWAFGFDLLRSAGDVIALVPGVLGSLAHWRGAGADGEVFVLELVSAGIAALIVAGSLAERIRLVPLLVFAALVGGIVFPIAASWHWGNGWLAARGFVDLGGATLVHSVAGWAALAGALVLGGRAHRFDPAHQLNDKEHHSIGLASFGTVLVFVGWQGVIGGWRAAGPLELGDAELARLLLNTSFSALAGCIMAFLAGYWLDRGRAVPTALNGVLAGLVAISADPGAGVFLSVAIGAVAGIITAAAPILLERMRIDDVTDAIPAHLGAGIWGTLAAAFTSPEADIGTQTLGVVAVGALSFAISFLVFLLLQVLVGIKTLPERLVNADA